MLVVVGFEPTYYLLTTILVTTISIFLSFFCTLFIVCDKNTEIFIGALNNVQSSLNAVRQTLSMPKLMQNTITLK